MLQALAVLSIVILPKIHLIVILLCSSLDCGTTLKFFTTCDCDSHMHYYLLLYPVSVLLFVILPDTLFDCDIPGITLNFDTPSKSFRV